MHASEIRARRVAMGLTQAELAQRLGTTSNTVARWERGERAPEHPGMLRIMLQHIDDELMADPVWREERNRRMRAQMENELQEG